MTREETTAFYRKHYRRIFNISLRIVRDSADAEEIMQDTILKYLHSAPSGLDEAQVSAWLSRTAIRKSLDRLRARKRRLWETADNLPDEEAPPGEEALLPDREKIRNAIGRLPEGYRLIVNLMLIEGLDYQEIAEYTGTKETTLRSQYSRGIAKLRKILKQQWA